MSKQLEHDEKSVAKKLMFLAWAKLLLGKNTISQDQYNALVRKLECRTL